jgi:tuftelin-interacting protein 11
VISRLQRVQLIAADVNSMSKELAAMYEVSLEPFSPLFHSFIDQYGKEFDRYQLDELVVAAITPLVRRIVTAWDPLKDPTGLISTFRGWRRALKVNHEEPVPQNQMSVYASETTPSRPDVYELISFNNSSSESFSSDTHMTYFESLLWNVWLPKVRTTINNEWSPENPQPAVKLYELWSTFLPPFIRDNFLDQLVLPKVQKAVSDWNSKRSSVSLQNIVFPWLPHVGLRLEDVIGDAKRKVKSLLRSWIVGAEMPLDLTAWKGVCGFLSSSLWTVLTINSFQVFDAGEWDAMMLKYIVPKLGRTLREDFRVNPRDQKMEPLQNVLQWSEIIRPSIFSQLLETEFFPKWLDILHIWLIQPKVNFGEVAIWYSFWKEAFPEAIRNLSAVSRGFTRGLQLMNRAIELGPRAPTELARPDFLAEISGPSSPVRNGVKDEVKIPARSSARIHEITFRSIVEEFVASHNLLFVPTGRAHERSRMPLYRVSATADGKHGLLVYILDDAVWASQEGSASSESDEFGAIGLEDIVRRATN